MKAIYSVTIAVVLGIASQTDCNGATLHMISGFGSGEWGSMPFTDVEFRILTSGGEFEQFTGDLAGAGNAGLGGRFTQFLQELTSSPIINILGLGSGVWDTEFDLYLTFYHLYPFDGVLLLDGDSTLFGIEEDRDANPFTPSDMLLGVLTEGITRPLPPQVGDAAHQFPETSVFEPIPTDRGELAFASINGPVSVRAIPEPTSAILSSLAITVGILSRRRSPRSSPHKCVAEQDEMRRQ